MLLIKNFVRKNSLKVPHRLLDVKGDGRGDGGNEDAGMCKGLESNLESMQHERKKN